MFFRTNKLSLGVKQTMRKQTFFLVLLSYGILIIIIMHLLSQNISPKMNDQVLEHRHHYEESDIRNMLSENPKIVASILEEIQKLKQKQDGDEYSEIQRKEGNSEVEEGSQKVNVVEQQESPSRKDNGDSAVLKPPINEEGLGEMGKVAVLEGLSRKELEEQERMFKQYGFNAFLSNKMSIHRSLPDSREEKCKEPDRHSPGLPATSIIICFYNEDWSALLRLVHSIISRTRDELIQEIMLIDDFSTMRHLKEQLDEYMSYISKVKVIHTKDRLGLVRARILGANAAKAPVLTFLDSHCEVTEGWLEPLLDTVKRNSKTAALPIIETIDGNDFHVSSTICNNAQVGGFDWGLTYTWHYPPKTDKERLHPCDNVKSPTMAGGLFSIDAKYFKDIGYYDENMDVWGGENLALSFKIWMCGGRIETVPCSHIGHIFRKANPYSVESEKLFGPFVSKNLVRVAEAWLDDRKSFFYKHGFRKYDVDVSKELAIRKNLQCKSFEWYLQNVYPDQFLPDKALASGELASKAFPAYCLDNMGESDQGVEVQKCHHNGGNQIWYYTNKGEIRNEKKCLDYPGNDRFIMYDCHGIGGNQYWTYNPETNEIKHPLTNRCMAMNQKRKTLTIEECGSGVHTKWKFKEEKKELMLQQKPQS